MLLIASADEYPGYCIASHISLYKPLRKDMRVLYTVDQPWIKNFRSKGVDTHYIKDRSNPNDLSLAMRNIDQTRTIELLLSLETEICPIDISDVCQTVTSFVLGDAKVSYFSSESHNNHVGQVYTLTGPEALTSKEILQMMSSATSFEGYKCHTVRPMDISFYFRNLGHNIWFDACIKNERLESYRDQLDCKYEYRSKALYTPDGT